MHGRANLMGHMGNFLGGGYEKTMKSNGMKNMLELLPSLIVIFFFPFPFCVRKRYEK